MAGAAVALAAGVIHWHDIPVVWHIVWDATFTFIALIVISLLLDEAGSSMGHSASCAGARAACAVPADRGAGSGHCGCVRQ
jgi:hypothetical protein